uniref:H/ACA ribonucleoprotein complex non-core subunit NAF1 n=1 Tax=Panagrellus redivivus TaxID=6233 RepID=A0A7E4VNK3_PANRE
MDSDAIVTNSEAVETVDTTMEAPTVPETPATTDSKPQTDNIEASVAVSSNANLATDAAPISVIEPIIPADIVATTDDVSIEVKTGPPDVIGPASNPLPDASNCSIAVTAAPEPVTDVPMETESEEGAIKLETSSQAAVDVATIPDADLFVIDTVGNKYLAPAEKAVPKPVETVSTPNLRGDPKVAAKYQWRQGSGFSEDVGDDSDSDSSDDDFEDEFKSILHGRVLVNEVPEPRTFNDSNASEYPKESKKNRKLDNDYYDLPNLDNLSLLCIDSLELAPFAKVVQHYDALLMLKAVPDVPYLDMDTMLFTENKTLVGTIYELMGLVSDPIYNILFPSVAECEKIPLGTTLYYAPSADETVTKLLFLDSLRNTSYWKNDDADSDNDEEEDEEARYYSNLRKQLEEYEKRKRGHKESTSASRSSSVTGPRQPKQARRGAGPAMPAPRQQPKTYAGFIPTGYPPLFAQPMADPRNAFGFMYVC